jgi:hypothetical protein
MRPYLITTGILFAIIAVGHIWEIIDRHHFNIEDPFVVLLAAGMSVWAWTLNMRVKTA